MSEKCVQELNTKVMDCSGLCLFMFIYAPAWCVPGQTRHLCAFFSPHDSCTLKDTFIIQVFANVANCNTDIHTPLTQSIGDINIKEPIVCVHCVRIKSNYIKSLGNTINGWTLNMYVCLFAVEKQSEEMHSAWDGLDWQTFLLFTLHYNSKF